MQIGHFLTDAGRDPYQSWLGRLKDLRARVAIQRRIDRLAAGNFGDHKSCGNGVWELRIDIGPGYRVYYAVDGQMLVLLRCGGNKRSQKSDIDTAAKYWGDYKRRAR